MRTLVCYYSKYGSAKEIAYRLEKEMNATVMDVKNVKDTMSYDQVVYVCAVYVGKIHASMLRSLEECQCHKIGLCLVGLNVQDARKVARENIKAKDDLLFVVGVGGVLDFSKMNFFERKIIKMINKEKKFIEKIEKGKRYEFWEEEGIQTLIQWSQE